MLRLHTRFGDQGTGDGGNLSDTDGTAAGPTYLTVAGGDSWGWFGRINPGFTLPAGIKQPEQRELPSNSSGHAGQGGDNALVASGRSPTKRLWIVKRRARVHGRRLAWRFGWQRSGDRSVLGCVVRASGGVAEPQRARV